MNLAVEAFEKTLALDSENLTAHYSLAQIYTQLGDETKAAYHRQEHEKYLPDYDAQDRAISTARRANPAADHAAQATVIYPLQRAGAPELPQDVSHPVQNPVGTGMVQPAPTDNQNLLTMTPAVSK